MWAILYQFCSVISLVTELRTGGIAGMDLPLWDLSEQQMQLRVNIRGVLVWGPLG